MSIQALQQTAAAMSVSGTSSSLGRRPLLSVVVRYHVVGEVSEVVQVSVRKDILNLITETEP